ncbi:MAG TPA: AAA family ATPase [Ktedonobacterales bacterium]
MTVSTDTAAAAKLAAVFDAPSKDAMLALDWQEFEDFVALVFESAGYAVEKVSPRPKHNVDLVLREGNLSGKIVARIEVRRYSTANIIRARVHQFYGALVQKGSAPGYIVTTSDFTKPAYEAAAAYKGKVTLINGDRFLRYIRYVHGTRFLEEGGESPNMAQPPILPSLLLEAEAIPRRDSKKTRVLAVANNKGGVAKTTTAVNIALILADKPYKKRVLLIDCDGQRSLTRLLPSPQDNIAAAAPKVSAQWPPKEVATLSDFFAGRKSLAEIVRDTHFDNVWLIPADARLAQLDINGSLLTERLLSFVRSVHDTSLVTPAGDAFDWIILDTPPAQGFCTRAALAASHFAIMPAQAEILAVQGAEGGLRTALTMRQLSGTGAKVLGAVITRFRQTVPSQDSLAELTTTFNAQQARVFPTKIPDDNKIERGHASTSKGGSLSKLFAGLTASPAARAYEALVKEILSYA